MINGISGSQYGAVAFAATGRKPLRRPDLDRTPDELDDSRPQTAKGSPGAEKGGPTIYGIYSRMDTNQDGQITGEEWWTVGMAVLVALGFTWAVPNKPSAGEDPQA